MGNLIGEPFESYVNNQIDARQQIYGKKTNRTAEEIAYLNSNNGWAKLASGITINDQRLALLKKNNNQMLNNVFTGKQLAMEYVLFNGLTSYTEGTDKDGNPNSKFYQSQYQGIGKGGRVAYGLDGTDFGYSPMPGLIDVDIKDLNRGSIKKATLTIKVFNRNQLEVIDCLYMRLGYTVLLEWGHSKYWDDVQQQLINQPASLIDTSFFSDEFNDSDYTKFIPLIKEHRKKTRGNYDAMFGTVSNFSWTFESDGSYNCKIEIISLGDIVESLGISVSTGESDNDRIAQIKLANSSFTKEPVDILNFYQNLYPGLETSLRDYYDKNVSILLNSDYSILRRNSGTPGYTAEITSPKEGNIGFVYTAANPVDLTDENKEFLKLKETNVNKYFGFVKSTTNVASRSKSIIASFYIRALQYYFENLEKKDKYLQVTFDENQTISNFVEIDTKDFKPYNAKDRPAGASKVGTVDFSYTSGSRTLTTDEAKEEGLIKDNKWDDNGYNPNNLTGTLVLKGYLGSDNPDGDLLSRKPLGFVNLAIANFSKNDIVEGPNQSYRFTNIQKQILLSPEIINFELFKKYIYNGLDRKGPNFGGFVGKNLAGGENDPQFKEQKEAQEAEEQEKEKGKKELMEFERIASEKSLRGNFFKYFYTIKKFYEPKAVASDEAKSKVWFEFNAEADLVSFPSLEARPPILTNFGEGEDLYVGHVINPYETSDSELIKKWNKEVGYPIYKEENTESGGTKFFPYNNKGERLGSAWVDFFRLNITNVDKSFYIQFGKLLSYLRDVCITSIDTEGAPPIIGIDTSELENVCYSIDTQYSLDPRKLIIRNDNFYVSEDTSGILFKGIRNFVEVTPEGTYGNLMNVYLNFSRIEELLTELADKRGEVKLFDFIESICEDINDCLGGVNNIEVTVNEDNKLVLRDQTPIPNAKNIFPDKFAAIDQQVPLEVFGYTDNKASFVHNIGFTTKISKEYATMITIGATSKGSVPGTEASAFSKWNIGIEDRFKNNLTSPDEANKEKLEPIDKLVEENKKNITSYTSNSLLGIQNQGFNSVKYGVNTFLTFNDEFIKNNSKIVKEFLKFEQAYVTLDESPENKGIVESSIGFIPFNLSVDMEGMSGFKIYNRLKVNTNFLPSNYDETLDFIVTGVNHKISSNQWKTSLATLATSKSVLIK